MKMVQTAVSVKLKTTEYKHVSFVSCPTESVHIHTWCDTRVSDMWWHSDQLRWPPFYNGTDEKGKQKYWKNHFWNSVWGMPVGNKCACARVSSKLFISSHSSQILNQVTPNPSEVKVLSATQNKNMNRLMKFLPRKWMCKSELQSYASKPFAATFSPKHVAKMYYGLAVA